MLSLLIAAALLQATPDAAAQPAAAQPPGGQIGGPRDNGMPKTDYELVAWCHGALAGQLELEPTAMADMVRIEGKAKVAARAKDDAEMARERREYLKDYEHALAAAEAASPTPIHQKGVEAELRGYALWAATRNKEPIWLMLDWGMWDPNDVGCSEAAKRLYSKSKLFGLALKGADTAPDSTGADLPPAPGDKGGGTRTEAPPPAPADTPAAPPATPAPTDPAQPAPSLRGPQ